MSTSSSECALASVLNMEFDTWVVWGVILAAVLLPTAAIYYYFTSKHNFWKKKNVPYVKPSFPFGNFNKVFTGRATVQQLLDEVYLEFKKTGYGGLYNGRDPTLIVCKPELIKHFLTKDFNSFHDRGIPYDEKSDPFSANLVNLGGQRWKVLRTKLSPTFTSGRIKGMFPLVEECTQELKEYIEEEIKKDENIDLKDLLIRYTTDVIGSCAFGINCNSIKNPNADFHTMSREVFDKSRNFNSIGQICLMIALTICPKLRKFFTTKQMFSKITTFFTELIDRTVKYRKTNHVERNDFVQLMMKIMDEESEEMSFNQDMMTAQAFVFFLAGLDNIAMTIGFCLHALAMDQELQERVLHEISTVLEEYDGKMCYDGLMKMDLVSRVLDEALRIYTPAGVLIRKQTEAKYVIPGTDIELEKGTSLMVPTQCLHNDEQYFPEPKKFDPDRFTEEEKSKRNPYVYMPFGEGPRFCIASRFAQLEMRLCLAQLVRHFNFSAGPKTDIFMELDPKSMTPAPKNNFWFRVTVR